MLSEQQQQYLDRFIAEYVRRTAASQARREAAWPALADARSSQGFFVQAPANVQKFWLLTKALATPSSPTAPRAPMSGTWTATGRSIFAWGLASICLGIGRPSSNRPCDGSSTAGWRSATSPKRPTVSPPPSPP